MYTARTAIQAAGLSAMLIVGFVIALVQSANAASEVNIVDGYAVHGYDVVAYFADGEPTPGIDAFTATHDGATYRFASADNRDRFAADPASFAPQYGGYCAFGTAMGRKFDGDPNAWAIVDGKLYLNLNKTVQARWKEDVPGFISVANNNWPLIRSIVDGELEAAAPAGVKIGTQ